MDEKAKAKRFKKRSKKEIILILLTVLFLTAAIISLGIYFYETVIVDEIDKSTVEKLEETIDLDLSTDTNIEEDTDEDDVYTEPAPEIVRVGVDEVDIDKISFIKPAHYRTRGGEWRGCIAATSHRYLSSVIR